MGFKDFFLKKRCVWHKHFVPSLVAGLAIAIIALLADFTTTNLVLFASVGASAAILSNARSHNLVQLHTALVSYAAAIIISLMLYFVNLYAGLPLAVNLFLAVFLTTIIIYMLNSFHPPAISASASFFLFERSLADLAYLFAAILVLFIIIRLLTYTLSQQLSLKEFFAEFRKEF